MKAYIYLTFVVHSIVVIASVLIGGIWLCLTNTTIQKKEKDLL